MKKYYTGVGSRKTPKNILKIMKDIAYRLSKGGYILRSGGATGADTAFEIGCNKANGLKEIYLPWNGFNKRWKDEDSIIVNVNRETYLNAIKLAEKIHPKWSILLGGSKKLHTRNVFQVLGKDLKKKSKFVICWTPNARITGGTATAINLALQNKIKVYNLANPNEHEELELRLNKLKEK